MNWSAIRKWTIGEFTWKRLVRSLLEIYAVLFLIGALCPYRLIFQPPSPSYTKLPGQFTVYSFDSNPVACVHMPVSNAYTLLYAHGNAEDMGMLVQNELFDLYNYSGLGVVSYDYRGYGSSGGKPTEATCYADIQAVYTYMTNTLGIPPERIIAYGKSVGSGMAVDVAMKNKVAGLVLESPMYTAYRVAVPMPIFPMDKFRNKDKIGKVNCPVLVIHGQSDWIIKPWHGRWLYELAKEPKMCFWVAGAGHNDVIPVAGAEYMEKLNQFVVMVSSNQGVRR